MTTKGEMRVEARARRKALARDCPDFAARIASRADELPMAAGASVCGYIALADEADPRLLIEALAAKDCEISYPRVAVKGQPLSFHVPLEGERMTPGAFHVLEPRPDWPLAQPTLLLVPLLAFDAEGHRLGYGGGYFDRTLAQFRATRTIVAIGVAFAGQEMARIPREAMDQPLDMLITESGVRRFERI